MHSEKQKNGHKYACMEMIRHKFKKYDLSDAFLRKAYKYTKAEIKDDTQENLHEFDYLK